MEYSFLLWLAWKDHGTKKLMTVKFALAVQKSPTNCVVVAIHVS